jgi:hypothetical protein
VARDLRALFALAWLAACRTLPPDLDALPEGAVPLPLSSGRSDSLECSLNDCTDWFRIEVAGPGDLRIQVEPAAASAQADAVRGMLLDPSGAELARVSPVRGRSGAAQIQLRSAVQRGSYLFAVFAEGVDDRIDYRLTAQFEPEPPPRPSAAPPPPPPRPPPPPAPPRFESRRTPVLEVEGAGSGSGSQMVLLEAGASEQMRPGLRGRLIEKGLPIGEIVIVDVYPEGSRARIETELRGAISAETIAEIQIPVETGTPERRRRTR